MQNSTSDIQSLATRVEKLEKQNRLLKRAGLTLLLLPVALVVMGQARPNRTLALEAQNFILSDSNGNLRAALVNDAGGASLTLMDSSGRQRVKLTGSSTFGPSVELDDENGFNRASVNLIGGQPLIIVNDKQGFSAQMGSVDLVTTRTGEQHKTSAASLLLFDKDSKVLWSAP